MPALKLGAAKRKNCINMCCVKAEQHFMSLPFAASLSISSFPAHHFPPSTSIYYVDVRFGKWALSLSERSGKRLSYFLVFLPTPQ